MSTTTRTHRLRGTLIADIHGLTLATLLAGIALVSALLVTTLGLDPATGTPGSADSSPGSQAIAGAGLAVYITIVAGAFVALLFIVRRLPAWVRETLSEGAYYTLLLLLGGIVALASPSLLVPALGVYFGAYVTLTAIDELGLWWALNNVMVLVVAVAAATAYGLLFGPWFVLVAIVGLSVYDHYFATKNEYMFDMAGAFVKRKLPMLFVWPATLRFQWDELSMEKDADRSECIRWGLGLGDLFLPAMFVAALAASWGGPTLAGVALPAWGVIALLPVAGLRIRYDMETAGPGAALPPIAVVCVVGFLFGAGVGVVVG